MSLAVAGGLIVVTATTTWLLIGTTEPGPGRVSRTTVTIPATDRLSASTGAIGSRVALSRDGTRLAYVAARDGGPTQVFVRSLDQIDAHPLPGTEDASEVFFSPDGEQLGFFSANALKKVTVDGGPVVTLHELETNAHGASWAADDTILFGRHNSSIWRVPAVGGVPTLVTTLEPDELDHANPHLLPGGQVLMFRAQPVAGGSNYVAVENLETGERRRLVDASRSWYLDEGYLAFALAVGGPVWVVPFDVETLALVGEPVMVVDQVARGWFAPGGDGSAVYARAPDLGTKELVWVDRQGRSTPIGVSSDDYAYPSLSPTGDRLAVSTFETVWVIDLARGARNRLTRGGRDHYNPVWFPDGDRVTFAFRTAESASAVYWAPADGAGDEELLVASDNLPRPGSWTPDGRTLVFTDGSPDMRRDLWALDRRQPDAPVVLVRTPESDLAPRLSPDGRWLAYVSDESGRGEIYVRPFPDPGNRVTVSVDGGTEPVWAPGGNELFYRNGNEMIVAQVATEESFVAGTPDLLFRQPYDLDPSGAAHPNYDVSRAGDRFVMVRSASAHLILVQNWLAEVSELFPPR